MEGIAIVGLSFKMPQDAEDELGFWRMLEERKNVMTEWPGSRTNIDSHYDPDTTSYNKLHSRGAHFIKQDPALFDAPFFSITAKEAAAMDPQHRMTLETAYRAFENAGMPIDKIKGSRTAVFSASMTDDYNRMSIKDHESVARGTITGNALALLPNRVSWHFDLLGPSVHIDTACSGSLVAVDLAVQSIHSGDASMALVTGANLILGPEGSILLSNGNYLSPDSVCYSFDHRANGYARGEGILGLVLKPVTDAVRDGDMIRAVIRATGSNQDGRTPILTQPSADSQEQLIRHVYKKAGLSFDQTRFFEAHGTGTAVGDPIEMKAIGRVFRSSRSSEEPLYVGSVKSNIGHTEGSAGLAGVVKALLTLEKGIIAPNALFEKINPEIDAEFYNIVVPTECIDWPSQGLRRVSVNSFGFGGANAHVVIDDALHYLEERGLKGNHHTTVGAPRSHEKDASINGINQINGILNGGAPTNGVSPCESHRNRLKNETNGTSGSPNREAVNDINENLSNGGERIKHQINPSSQLMVWSAADEHTLEAMTQSYQEFISRPSLSSTSAQTEISYTLAVRRSVMLWRTFAVADTAVISKGQINEYSKMLSPAKASRASADAALAFIFTGQGAQYVNMGRSLVIYPVFEKTLKDIDAIFHGFGCKWSLFDELAQVDHIDRPEYSQPLCTALQIGLVELLKSFDIKPSAVMGHSSGEIAAAYAAGALSISSACKVAYYRGLLASKLKANTQVPGAMLSANIPADEVPDYLDAMDVPDHLERVTIACINSPQNVTLSGPEEAIDLVKEHLDTEGVFSQKLKTGVAYHSVSMQAIASEYSDLMGVLEPGDNLGLSSVAMISSVTGEPISLQKVLSQARYWIDNLVSPVRFSDALRHTVQAQLSLGTNPLTHLIEVGPHPALRRPIQDTLQAMKALDNKQKGMRYSHVLNRTKDAHRSMLDFAGQLFCDGFPVKITAVNRQCAEEEGPRSFRVDCPEYPFNHTRSYWLEPRLSRDSRLRVAVPMDSLGARFHDWNPREPKWRRFLSVESTPWTKDHTVVDTVLYPGAGMVVMALEAVKQICPENRQLVGFFIKEASFINPIIVGDTGEHSTETFIQLHRVHTAYEKESTWSEVTITTQSKDKWTECFRATVQIQYEEGGLSEVDSGLESQLWNETATRDMDQAKQRCVKKLDSRAFYKSCHDSGLMYGPTFQLLKDISWDGSDLAIGRIDVTGPDHKSTSIIHPAVLDCATQVILAQVSNGLSDWTATYVPSSLHNAWFSAAAWHPPETTSVNVWTEAAPRPSEQEVEAAIRCFGDQGKLLCSIESINMKTVSSAVSDTELEKSKLLYGIEWNPQLSLMSSRDLFEACGANVSSKDDETMAKFRKIIEPALNEVIRRTLRDMPDADRLRVPDFLRKHLRWMEHHLAHEMSSTGEAISHCEVEMMLTKAENIYPSWSIFPVIARKLQAILMGEVDPLQISFETGLAERFYANVFNTICDDNFGKLLELLSHENPTMRVLEVGAGTGGMTGHMLSALGALEQRHGGTRFSEYTYTDISPSFFENAGTRFQEHKDRMSFGVFDLDRTAAEQGFEEKSYDLVVAGCVLHATRNLSSTLQNISSLLKPGGRILYLEVVAPVNVITNFAFGLLPGWWSALEESRGLSPTITEDQWDQTLRENGFSGNDLVLRDYKRDDCHTFSMMVSTLEDKEQNAAPRSGRLVFIVPSLEDTLTIELGTVIKAQFQDKVSHIVTLDQVQKMDFVEDDVVISLLESQEPFLSVIREAEFATLKDIIQRTYNLLWVTCAGFKNPRFPEYEVMRGFLRSVRFENADKRMFTLAIEQDLQSSSVGSCAKHVATVASAAFDKDSDELEYRATEDQLMTARLVEEIALDTTLRSFVSPQLQQEPWNLGPPIKLSLGRPGFLDSLEFVYDAASEAELAPHDIEIDSKAWALNFRDVLVALGRIHGDDLGYDCAGVVTRVGSACSDAIRPGDRVLGSSIGCMRSKPRAHFSNFTKIPKALSFEAAASLISPGVTAYFSLVEVARLRKGDKILIHAATGATGQMAVWVAKMLGAEVFATVGFDEKKDFLMSHFGIPGDHIFYSRNTSFARGIMRMTDGYGVDVVLNSLSGDGLRASWECIAPYGRFIEIGKADITANSGLPMAKFARNVSFCAVDLHHIAQSNPMLANGLLEKVLGLVTSGVIQTPAPLNIFSGEETEQAFRFLQGGKSMGRIIISVSDTDVVPKRLLKQSTWKFDPDASYVIVGASGGLGRAISQWMARKGAKHLILLSRTGATSAAAAKLVAGLQKDGVNVAAPKCDVSSESSLSAVLQECALTMPPVKGCINSAMALNDIMFDQMTHAQWQETIRSKVQSSWNLHRLLPESLDFFVLLSSLSGIYGSIGQSNYAGGCAMQDALARYRTSKGLKAVSFDLGWMSNIGIVAETESYQANRRIAADMMSIEDIELMALLDMYCDPSLPVLPTAKSQLLVGAVTPADCLMRGSSPPSSALRPMFSAFSIAVGRTNGEEPGSGAVNYAALFRQAARLDERAAVVVQGLAAKLARAMSISADDVEPLKQLSDYGVDSLMAIELRNWISKDFRANVAVFEIMSGTNIAAIGNLVVSKSELVTEG